MRKKHSHHLILETDKALLKDAEEIRQEYLRFHPDIDLDFLDLAYKRSLVPKKKLKLKTEKQAAAPRANLDFSNLFSQVKYFVILILPSKEIVFIFDSKELANAFFAEMAKKSLFFLNAFVDMAFRDTGYYNFSCGTGQCFNGSYAEIKGALTSALKTDPENEALLSGLAYIDHQMGLKFVAPVPRPNLLQ